MYDTLIAFHTLELIQESLNKICLRFSGISCSDDFLMSESGMMKLDSICDIIVHHYFDVDADEIYRICQEDIPQLHRVITRMMDDLKIV